MRSPKATLQVLGLALIAIFFVVGIAFELRSGKELGIILGTVFCIGIPFGMPILFAILGGVEFVRAAPGKPRLLLTSSAAAFALYLSLLLMMILLIPHPLPK